MGKVMLILSPTRHNPKSVDLALSLVGKTKRPLLAVFIVDTKVSDAISGRIVDIGFLGDRVSTQLKNAILSDYETRGRRELEEVRERAEGLGIPCETVIGRGDFVGESLRIATDEKVEDIVQGLCRAVAERTRALAQRLGIEPEVTMTGGVAKNLGVVHALEELIGHKFNIPDEPQIAGALGAALFAREAAMAEAAS